MKYFCATLLPNNMLRESIAQGLGVAHLAERYGFSQEELDDPFAWVELDPVMALLGDIGRESGIENIGFFLGSQPYHPSQWGVGGYALDTSPNMSITFELILGLTHGNSGVAHVAAGFMRENASTSLYLRPNDRRWDTLDTYMEYWLTLCLQGMRCYAGTRLVPLEVSFAHPRRGKLVDYEEFFGCPVNFDQSLDMFRFDSAWEAIEGPKRDPLLQATLLKLVQFYVEAQPAEVAFANEVAIALERQLGRNILPTLASIAQELCVSERQVQRRLREECKRFSNIWDEVRKNYATMALKSGDKPIAEISYALGYNEIPAFYAAFKRWTGMTPKDFLDNYSSPIIGKHPIKNPHTRLQE